MNKFSVIIPTMWRSERTVALLRELDRCSLVDEIILIDNDRTKTPELSGFGKLFLIQPPANIYVNPAWNLGAEAARNEWICFCNDDISFDSEKIFGFVAKHSDKLGYFGIHPSSFNAATDTISLEPGNYVGEGWGVLIFTSRSNYYRIPDALKIWYGDCWFVRLSSRTYSLRARIETEMSTTSGGKEFKGTVNNDTVEWEKITPWNVFQLRSRRDNWLKILARLKLKP